MVDRKGSETTENSRSGGRERGKKESESLSARGGGGKRARNDRRGICRKSQFKSR